MARLLALIASVLSVSACASMATLGDDAIRQGSFNRIQATPFQTALDTQACGQSLTEMFGVTKRSLDVHHGVQIAQVYRCEGSTIISSVTLKNRTSEAMICYPTGDAIGFETWVAPTGVAFNEYSFQASAGFECAPAERLYTVG